MKRPTSTLPFGKKTTCPCGKTKNYCPVIGSSTAGKCFSAHCGQKFFPLTDAEKKRGGFKR